MGSPLGVKRLDVGPTQSDLRIFARRFLQTCLGVPGTDSFRNQNEAKIVYSYGNA